MTEFTVVFGKRFRTGELLLTVITAAFFLATLAMWRSTRKIAHNAREASEKQLRAYLHVTNTEFRGGLGGEPKFCLEYANLGQTPAYGVAGWSMVELRRQDSDLPFLNVGEIETYGDIGPGQRQEFVRASPVQLASSEINDIISGASKIYVYGEFTYRDAFGKSRRTQFRKMLAEASRGGERMVFGVCPDGNMAN